MPEIARFQTTGKSQTSVFQRCLEFPRVFAVLGTVICGVAFYLNVAGLMERPDAEDFFVFTLTWEGPVMFVCCFLLYKGCLFFSRAYESRPFVSGFYRKFGKFLLFLGVLAIPMFYSPIFGLLNMIAAATFFIAGVVTGCAIQFKTWWHHG